MSVTLNLPPEVEARVHHEAAKHALPVETFLEHLVAEAFPQLSEPERRHRSLALLHAVRDLGDDAEQQETFTYLKQAVEADRLSNRKRFS